jgi:hypothetical protein
MPHSRNHLLAKISVAWRMPRHVCAARPPSHSACATHQSQKHHQITHLCLFTKSLFLTTYHLALLFSINTEHAANLSPARQTSAQYPRASTRFPHHLAPRTNREPHARRDAGRDMRICRCHCAVVELAVCAVGFVAV